MDEGLFKLKDVDEKYYEGDLIETFGLNPTRPIADGYGHFKDCTWFVQEVEGSDIDWAVEQVKSTVEQLEFSGRSVSAIFIIVKNAFKSRKYESRNGILHVKGQKNPYIIRGKFIRIIPQRAIDTGGFKWQSFSG
jgi:hypothetical protein